MPVVRLIAAALTCLALTVCFQSSTEFIPAAQAEFPFETITSRAVDEEDAYTLSREGDSYRPENEDTTVRLKKITGDTWLVQTAVVDDGKTVFLYGVAVLDAGGKRFKVYKALAEDADRDPAVLAKYGLSICAEEADNVCPPSAEAYLAYARDRIAAGDAPSSEFEILERK
ncbi:MAG TPA: hypothetical protein VK844_04735 [Hyphomicrobiales bacterium]|nr:hypothetical protein [Hyphomicrobiales bacterium]